MSESKCGPLAAGILGFVLGAVVVKLVERFCPLCGCCGTAGGCCCGEAECCCDEDGGSAEGCCCGDAAESPSDGEAEPSAE